MQRILAVVAIIGIRLYQMTWARLHGRTCLFSPTCSHQAIEYFRELGFRKGLAATQSRLKDCSGTYSLRLGEDNRVEMVTESGRVVIDSGINPVIKSKLLFFDPTVFAAEENRG